MDVLNSELKSVGLLTALVKDPKPPAIWRYLPAFDCKICDTIFDQPAFDCYKLVKNFNVKLILARKCVFG